MKGRAAVVVAPGRFEIREYPVPEVEEDCLLLTVGLGGICGTEVHLIQSSQEDRKLQEELPLLLGHEIVGHVVAMGKRANEVMVTDEPLREGDRVVPYVVVPCGECWPERRFGLVHGFNCLQPRAIYARGNPELPPHFISGWADYLYVRPGSWLWKLPDHVPFEVGVLTEPFAIAIRAVEKAQSLPAWMNEQILSFSGVVAVLGSGAIGVLTAAAARIAGAHRIILVGGPQNALDIACELGIADHTFNVLEVGPEERIQLVRDLTPHGYGADVVFEAAGVPAAFVEGLEMLRRMGTFVELGCFFDTGATVPLNVARHITSKDLNLYSVSSRPPHHFSKALDTFARTYPQIDYGRLLTAVFDLEDAQQAYELATDPQRKGIKVALRGIGYS